MSFEELKSILTTGIPEGTYKTSLEGIITCCEKLGKTVDETIKSILEVKA